MTIKLNNCVNCGSVAQLGQGADLSIEGRSKHKPPKPVVVGSKPTGPAYYMSSFIYHTIIMLFYSNIIIFTCFLAQLGCAHFNAILPRYPFSCQTLKHGGFNLTWRRACAISQKMTARDVL